MKKLSLLFVSGLICNSLAFSISMPASPSTPSSFLPQIPLTPLASSVQLSSMMPSRIVGSPINGSSSGVPSILSNLSTLPVISSSLY